MNLTQEHIDELKSTIDHFADNLTLEETANGFGNLLQPFMQVLKNVISGFTKEESETIQSIIFKND